MAASETSQRLQLARDLQRSLSPEVMPRLEGYELAAYSQPAELVGGDCYDVNLNGRLNLLIADATGHGLSAAVYMARTQAYLRSGLAAGQRPEEVLVEVNRRLVAERSFRMFATVVCAQLDPVARLLRYARAGHNPPLLVRGQQVEALESGAGPLGLFRDFHLQDSAVALEEGDVLVLYTDGLIEALNAQREQFTEERLIALLLGAAPQEDDITVAVLRVGPVGGGPPPAPSRLLIGGERRPVALGFVRLGRIQEACRASAEAVALLESQGKVGGNHEEGLLEERILFEHYRVLSAAGRRAEGRPYLRRARDGLMALAEAVGEEHREAVLCNLKFHRELAAAWEA